MKKELLLLNVQNCFSYAQLDVLTDNGVFSGDKSDETFD